MATTGRRYGGRKKLKHSLERDERVTERGFLRKRNRLRDYDYSSNNLYFITFNTKDYQNILCDGQDFEFTDVGCMVQEAIEAIPGIYEGVELLTYIIMPNHVHLLLLFHGASVTVSRVIQQMKGVVRKKAKRPIWHTSFYDRIVRDEREMQLIWNYIDNNPGKWLEDRYYRT